MTEIDTLRRAKMYLDKLANGIDPITDSEMPHDTLLNNVRLSRCFFYVSDILRQVIDNGGEVGRRGRQNLPPFTINRDEIASIPVSDNPVYISHFTNTINTAVNHADQKKLSYRTITNWLVEKGYLRSEESDGKTIRKATEYGLTQGITEELRENPYGSFIATLYHKQMQQLIIDNLVNIVGAADGADNTDGD